MYKDHFDYGIYTGCGISQPYRIYLPKNAEGKKIPAVLFLHGAGERGDDNEAQLRIGLDMAMAEEDGPLYGAMVIAPQCPLDCQWVAADWSRGIYSMDETPETPYLRSAISLFLEKCREHGCDFSRLYIMGISMGGFGTWDAVMRYPDVFAAAFPCCGGADPSKAELIVNLPVYTFHGDADETVPVCGTREIVAAIRRAGGKDVRYKEYPGVGHWCWDAAFSEKEEIAHMFTRRRGDA